MHIDHCIMRPLRVFILAAFLLAVSVNSAWGAKDLGVSPSELHSRLSALIEERGFSSDIGYDIVLGAPQAREKVNGVSSGSLRVCDKVFLLYYCSPGTDVIAEINLLTSLSASVMEEYGSESSVEIVILSILIADALGDLFAGEGYPKLSDALIKCGESLVERVQAGEADIEESDYLRMEDREFLIMHKYSRHLWTMLFSITAIQ